MATMIDRLALELEQLGLISPARITANRSIAEWTEIAIRRGEGELADSGALVCLTGSRTARSPMDRYLVREPSTSGIHWNRVNLPMEPEVQERLLERVKGYYHDREVFVQDGYAGADHRYRQNVRFIGDESWHALAAHHFFRPIPSNETHRFKPDWTILAAAKLRLNTLTDSLRSDAAIIIRFSTRTILILGTSYAGEIKKALFTALSTWLPEQGVLPLHAAATIGASQDSALYIGLSGTGKTILSADVQRRLVGDDEIAWSDAGIFNLEGGCYAKTIQITPETAGPIHQAIRFGTILENVPLVADTREANFASQQYTENTRAIYPLQSIPGAELSGCGPHPNNLFFLSCDAFGVLPPICQLNAEQAIEQFLCGYTAKVAQTEMGIKEPLATFSSCFGAPFMPLSPKRYAQLLREKIDQHSPKIWLVNTGWTAGPYGIGSRIPISTTRLLIRAALQGEWDQTTWEIMPHFGYRVPKECTGIPTKYLQPQLQWADVRSYDEYARKLRQMFQEELAKHTG